METDPKWILVEEDDKRDEAVLCSALCAQPRHSTDASSRSWALAASGMARTEHRVHQYLVHVHEARTVFNSPDHLHSSSFNIKQQEPREPGSLSIRLWKLDIRVRTSPEPWNPRLFHTLVPSAVPVKLCPGGKPCRTDPFSKTSIIAFTILAVRRWADIR